MDYFKDSAELHRKLRGKISVEPKARVRDRTDLSLLYTPGVAQPSREIASNPELVFDYTIKGNAIAVVSDGSAVLGLGNIGAAAAIPVMEGKALLFKELAGIDAFPICLNTQEPEEIVNIVKNIAPVFGGINLEDIAAPNCFKIERELQGIGIPVMHDDQHGTAIVVLAGLLNSCKVVGKELGEMRIVISGSGAAGTAVARMLSCVGDYGGACRRAGEVIVVDRKGIINSAREGLTPEKSLLAAQTNSLKLKGSLEDALKGADVFIGVSAPDLLSKSMVKSMVRDAVVFAMANPTPEIMPDQAKEGGARVVATGRSDFPNQVNNALAFPGVFRGALDAKATKITDGMKLAAAYALAGCVEKPSEEEIIPEVLDRNVVKKVADAVREAAVREGVTRK